MERESRLIGKQIPESLEELSCVVLEARCVDGVCFLEGNVSELNIHQTISEV